MTSPEPLELETRPSDLLANGLRVLFTFHVTEFLFTESDVAAKEIFAALAQTFDDLETRFGVKVLGTLDDDLLSLGPSELEPIGYVLAEAPDLEAAVSVVNLIRTRFKGAKLARYLRLKARIGRPLFYATR